MADTTLKIDYTPGATIEKFIASTSVYNICCGARGSGKTTGGFMRHIVQAQRTAAKYHPLRCALVRDTRRNIGLTTARTILKWCPKPYSVWAGKTDEPERCTIFINNKPLLTFDFFGVNSPADLDRFQSFECAFVWIEEPAPLATNSEFIASGIAESVLASAVTSMRSSPHPSVAVTMNPPSADHWTAQLWRIPGYEAMDIECDMAEEQVAQRENIRKSSSIFMVPPSECAAEIESPGYTQRNREILLATGRQDLYARLVEGRVGYANIGERVCPEWNGSHLAPGLTVIPNVPLLLSFDYGLNPTCIVAQVSPAGYLLIHRAFSRENMGMKQLLQAEVHPYLTSIPVTQWSYCGGPEAVEREQSDSEETALRMIQKTLGHAPYRSGPVSWSARREGLRDALTRSPGGMPWVRVNPAGAALLVRCLEGGWHYASDPQGHVRNDSPDKRSRWDHLGDAFSHLCAVLLRKTDREESKKGQLRGPSRLSAQRQKYGITPSGSSRTGV